jgi:hypothetical protein
MTRLRIRSYLVTALGLVFAPLGLSTSEVSAGWWHPHCGTVSTYSSQGAFVPMGVVGGQTGVVGGQTLVGSQALSAFAVQPQAFSAFAVQPQAFSAFAVQPQAFSAFAFQPQAFIWTNQAGTGGDTSGGTTGGQKQVGFSAQAVTSAQAQAVAEASALADQHSALASAVGGKQPLMNLITIIRNEISKGNTNKGSLLGFVLQILSGSIGPNVGPIVGPLISNLIDDLLGGGGPSGTGVSGTGGSGAGVSGGTNFTVTIPPIQVTVNKPADGTTPGPTDTNNNPRPIQLPQAVKAQIDPLADQVNKLQADVTSIKTTLEAIKNSLPHDHPASQSPQSATTPPPSATTPPPPPSPRPGN